MSGAGRVVCVTGASGYLASWLVKYLLERGYTVKATVRDLSNPKKVAHLKALDGAEERLELFEAELLQDGAFDSVIDGCHGVFHTASPAFMHSTDPQREVIEPAVNGTLNVLRSCSKAKSVRRVVMTSSMTAVMFNRNPKGPDVVVDETWFSVQILLNSPMAGRNHTPMSGSRLRRNNHRIDDSVPLHQHRRLTPAEVRLIEERIASQSLEIQTLLHDNQRLAATHVALKQDVVVAQQDLRRLSATASSAKVERDAQVQEVYERSLKLEAEARSVDDLSAELERVRAEITELRDERKVMSDKLKDIQDDISNSQPKLQEFSDVKAEIEAWQREIRRGRAAVEYERKMHSDNLKLSEAMEKHMFTMAREAEKLRSELANAEQRVMAAVVDASSAANQGAGYAIHQPVYGGNSLSDPHVAHQVAFNASTNYGYGGGPPVPPGPYDIQR